MDIGVATTLLDGGTRPDVFARLAQDRGFESFWLGEHTHLPVGSRNDEGALHPDDSARMLDPFVALTAAALATTSLRVGFAVCLVAQRDPIVTAKAVATLDVLAGGRVEFGVGAGWIREEMRTHGTDPRHRMAVTLERTQAIQAIWTQDEAEFHGRFVDLPPVMSWPKPLQRPHPPILVGGDGPTVEDRVLALGAEWMPISQDPGLLDRWRRLCERAGRTVPLTIGAAPADPGVLSRFRDAGVRRCVVWLDHGVENSDPAAFLDRVAEARDRM